MYESWLWSEGKRGAKLGQTSIDVLLTTVVVQGRAVGAELGAFLPSS